MNSRERYLAVIRREDTDRPAFDLMGTASGLTTGAFRSLKALLQVEGEDREFRKGQNVRFYNEALLEKLEIDARRVWMRALPEQEAAAQASHYVDEWGIERGILGSHVQQVSWPLRNATMKDLEAYAWPVMLDDRRVEGLREEAQRLHAAGEYAVIGRSPIMGIFELGHALHAMDQYFMNMLLEPKLIEMLNEKITDLQIQLYGLYLDRCGEFLDVIETGDDYGAANGLMMSPDSFRQLIKPYRKKLNEFIKSKAPHIRIFHHTCGGVRDIIGDLIDIGVDILNPIQPVAGMEPEQLVREFGKDICFHGAVDTISVLRGSVDEVRCRAKELCRAFSGGHWIVAPANHVQDDIPVENIVALYEAIKEEGR